MANIGALGVEITANDAELRAAMKRAADATVGAFGQMDKAAAGFEDKIKKFVTVGSAVGLATKAFEKFKDAIDDLDSLNDLSKRTAIAVETLAGFRLAAEQSGASLEDIANAVKRLTKAQIAAADGDEKMQSLFKTLGVTAREPAGAIVQLAKAFEGLDEQARLEVAVRIGKGFDKLIPLLGEGAEKVEKMVEVGTRLSKVTKEAAEAADNYKDKMAEIKAASAGTWTKIATDALPVLTRLAIAFRDAQEAGGLFRNGLIFAGGNVLSALFSDSDLSPIQKAKKEFEDLNKAIETQSARLKENSHYMSENARVAIQRGIDKNIAARDLVSQRIAALTPPEEKKRDINKELCEGSGGTWDGKVCTPRADVDALRKKLLENNLKSLDRDIGAEKDLLSDRNHILDLLNKRGLLSFEEYYDGRKAAAEEALKNTLADYDKEIAAAKQFIAASTKDTDKAEGQGKLDKARDERAKAVREANKQALDDTFAQGQAYHELAKQVEQTEASVLEFTGKLRESALIRFDASNLEFGKSLANNQDFAGLIALGVQRKQVEAQAKLNELTRDANILGEQRANVETSITLAQERGDIGELASLKLRSAARSQQIEELQKIYELELDVAYASENPAAIQAAKNLGIQLEVLRSQADLVKKAFDDIFVGSFTDGLASFISGTKSAKAAFNDMVNSIVSSLSRLAAQDIARSLFGGGTSSGSTGLFGLLSSFFGGGSGSSGVAGPGLFANLAGNFGDANGAAFNGGRLAFANGGAFTNSIVSQPTQFRFANGHGLMGEAGPEAIMPLARDSSGRLGVRGGGDSVYAPNITFHINTPDANSFRQSEGQIAAQMAGVLARGRRNR